MFEKDYQGELGAKLFKLYSVKLLVNSNCTQLSKAREMGFLMGTRHKTKQGQDNIVKVFCGREHHC